MQLVIKISDDTYKYWKEVKPTTSNIYMIDAIEGIINGTPLPEGHGDLVDISPYKGKVICSHLYSGVKKLIEVDSIKPIIEAEESEEE